MSINRVVISGNLTRDPELRSTASGMAVLSFGVAVNDRRRNPQTDQWEDYPNFIDCTVFGNRAQGLANILTKGMKVAIEGRLRYSTWETQDGQKRSKIEVIADNVDFMSRRDSFDGAGGGQRGSFGAGGGDMGQSAQVPKVDISATIYDEDIPF